MAASAFTQKDNYGTSVQRGVEKALTRARRKFEVIEGKDERQAFGDILLSNAAVPTYLEVKGNRNYDDHLKRYNVYFELFEAYARDYSNNAGKARTLELVGVLNQLDFDREVRTIFVHKLGSTDAYLVYSPARILDYFNREFDHESRWLLDTIVSEDADGQEGKFKMGVRIKGATPEKLENFRFSALSKYASLATQETLVDALKVECGRFEQGGDPTAEFRRLLRSVRGERWLSEQDWWYYPVKLRKQLAPRAAA